MTDSEAEHITQRLNWLSKLNWAQIVGTVIVMVERVIAHC